MSHLVPSYRRKPRNPTPEPPAEPEQPTPTPDVAAAAVLPPVPAVTSDAELDAAVAKLSRRKASRRPKKGTAKK